MRRIALIALAFMAALLSACDKQSTGNVAPGGAAKWTYLHVHPLYAGGPIVCEPGYLALGIPEKSTEVDVLRILGGRGWELVSIQGQPNDTHEFYFKKLGDDPLAHE